ncbi:MAG: hypothetical protein GEV08_16855 [Acidimicrobiia bacterium]|nr:hypothetical protein [Acidimicrobiia bacterium]
MTPPAEDLDAAREQGRRDGAELAERKAPTDPLLRLAWADGLGDTDHVREAVRQARGAGAPWKDIAEVLGITVSTAKTRFTPSGYERMQRYRERKRQQGDEG